MTKQGRWASLGFVVVAGLLCGTGCIAEPYEVEGDIDGAAYEAEGAEAEGDAADPDDSQDGAGGAGGSSGSDPSGLCSGGLSCGRI